MLGGCKFPEQKEPNEAGDDSRQVWDHDVTVIQLEAVEHPRCRRQQGAYGQGEGQTLHVASSQHFHQGRQRRQVHGDGDHAAGEAQLVETGFPLSEEHAEVEPTACQDQARRHHMGQHHFLIIAVVEVDEDVQDLQLSSDGVDHLQRHVCLQNPIIQPAQVVEARREEREKLDVFCAFGLSHLFQVRQSSRKHPDRKHDAGP